MKCTRIAMLSLLAVFVASLAATATASALETEKPFWEQCGKVAEPSTEGIYKEPNCTMEVPQTNVPPPEYARVEVTITGGTAEIGCQENIEKNGLGNPRGQWTNKCITKVAHESATATSNRIFTHHQFTAKSGASSLISSLGTIECKSDEVKSTQAHFTGPKHIEITVHFHGCTLKGKSCTTAGEEAGQITTVPLIGWLIYTKETAPVEVGMFLSAVTGEAFAEFECEGVGKIKVISRKPTKEKPKGSCIAGNFTKIALGTFSKEATLSFAEKEKLQEIEKFKYKGENSECRLEVEFPLKIKGTGNEVTTEEITTEDAIDTVA